MPAPHYVSTRDPGGPSVSFAEALAAGLAPDGGLFVPTHVPPLPNGWRDAPSLPALATAMLTPWLEEASGEQGAGSGDAPPLAAGRSPLAALLADALDFPVPLVPLTGDGWDGVHVLELIHGPTLSFKDVGARTMARWMTPPPGETLTILAATSGDTGSAVADGFAGRPGVRVVLLYPTGGVSDVQERQLIAARDGVTALAVEGTFDDCQRIVKAAFSRPTRPGQRLSSANSINVGRLLPQMTYYAWALAQLEAHSSDARSLSPPGRGTGRGGQAVLVVPSGNLGNLTAGLLAAEAGLPVARFVAAHNANRGFADHLAGGPPPSAPTVATLSNAMDVGRPSNFERLASLFPGRALPARVTGHAVSDDETLATMRDVYEATGYVACPHTAVGLAAARRDRASTGDDSPRIVLATAHPAKFPEAVERATGRAPEVPPRLAALVGGATRVTTIPATDGALAAVLDAGDEIPR